MANRFDENDARVVGRTARGVKAITLDEGDEVVGMAICEPNKLWLTISETGYGRLSELSDYRVQSRGGKGLTNYHTDEYGNVAAVRMVSMDEDIIMISAGGIIIRLPVSEIRQCRRPSKGVTVMKFRVDGDRIVSLVQTPHEEEEVEVAEATVEASTTEE